MYLNKTVFKRLIKDAYNSGILKVGRVFDGFIISGSCWAVWADEEEMPNWFKAAVIEYTGKIPESGKVIRFGKQEIDQYVLPDDCINVPDMFSKSKVLFEVTPIVYGGTYNRYRFLQNKQTHRIATLSEELYSVIDFSNLCKSDKHLNGINEDRPAGPVALNNSADVLYWKNEQCALALCTARTGSALANEIISLLSEVDFGEVEK